MDNICSFSRRPVAFLARYVRRRAVPHGFILAAVIAAVICSVCAQYGVKMLVHFECFEEIDCAIHREKRLKKWNRSWKLELIEQRNPEWRDLYGTLSN